MFDVPQALAHMGEKEWNTAKKKVHRYTGMFVTNVLKAQIVPPCLPASPPRRRKVRGSFCVERGQPAGVCEIPNSHRPA